MNKWNLFLHLKQVYRILPIYGDVAADGWIRGGLPSRELSQTKIILIKLKYLLKNFTKIIFICIIMIIKSNII